MSSQQYKYIGALIGHPRSGTSYFKRVVHHSSVVSPFFSHCHGEIVIRWDLPQKFDDRFVFDCDCPDDAVVLLERDARDIAVSGWFFVRHRLGVEDLGTEQEFIDRVMPFILNWQEGSRRFVPLERRVQYSEMTESQAIYRALAGMKAEPRSPRAVKKVIENLAFEKLQRRDMTGVFSRSVNRFKATGGDVRTLSFRNGKSGGWKEFPADFSRWCL